MTERGDSVTHESERAPGAGEALLGLVTRFLPRNADRIRAPREEARCDDLDRSSVGLEPKQRRPPCVDRVNDVSGASQTPSHGEGGLLGSLKRSPSELVNAHLGLAGHALEVASDG